jgi:hypothetical protein
MGGECDKSERMRKGGGENGIRGRGGIIGREKNKGKRMTVRERELND